MAGMFDFISQPTYRDLAAEEQASDRAAREVATMNLGDAAAYTAYKGGEMLGKGVGQLAGGALGVDTREPQAVRADAIEKVKAQVAADMGGIDPSDPKFMDQFYPSVIRALIAQKMPFEAAAVQKEYQAQRATGRKLDTAQAAIDQKAKAASERNAAERAKLESRAPKLMQYVAEIEKRQEALAAMDEDDPSRPMKQAALKNFVDAAKREGAASKLTVVPQGDRVVVIDINGDQVYSGKVGAKPMSEDQAADNARAAATAADKKDKGKEGAKVPAETALKISNGLNNVQQLAALAGSFRPEYSGGWAKKIMTMFGGEDIAVLASRLAANNPEAANWWQRYHSLVTQIRNALFGATLTEGEKQAFALIKASIGDDPALALSALNNQASEALAKAEANIGALGGYNTERLEGMLTTARGAVGSMPRTVGKSSKPTAGAAAPAAAAAPATARKPLDLNAYRK